MKKTAQHGSGMHNVFDAIATKHGFDESTISTRYLNALNRVKRSVFAKIWLSI